MHKDKNTISTVGLPEIPKEKSDTDGLLEQGYKLFRIDGSWYCEKENKRTIVTKK